MRRKLALIVSCGGSVRLDEIGALLGRKSVPLLFVSRREGRLRRTENLIVEGGVQAIYLLSWLETRAGRYGSFESCCNAGGLVRRGARC